MRKTLDVFMATAMGFVVIIGIFCVATGILDFREWASNVRISAALICAVWFILVLGTSR